MEQEKLTVEYINKISYTDFVGLINQWNVLPGSHTTLSKWRVFSQLNKNSKLLEVACTTGFSSRELALQSGCSGEGIDISDKSVAMANYNRNKYATNIDFNYHVADGYTYESKSKFTHIVVGAALGFFSDPVKMLEHCVSLLEDGGYVLASPFYVTESIPQELVERAQKVFEITPTTVSYKEIMKHYRELEVVYEDRNELVQETEEELAHYCSSTVSRAVKMLDVTDKEVEQAMYDRLYSIKEMSNDLRPYQRYSVLVLRYRSDVFPNRYVELF
ncbi:class I SAM-dependent methyltransferase [candidate division WWE3 bacterium]|uniref:Class I SAM-dependent methyltransferase n=1 Tax=candidate division WWE3 bacterium TaxID=2053526 RepID=A0A955LW60_UNCKA|nr:class I SAM-dependent methyltransferase [candidate division WWE3 bacterium]